MVGLASTLPPPPPLPPPTRTIPWSAAQSRAQFAALAQLRWCIFRNAFRRKGGIGELIARIVLLPFLAVVAIGPIIGAGFGGYFLISSGKLSMLPILTWAIFALWQVVVLNISPPNLSFDINTIIRFSISFPRYLAARLVFGLLSASNVIGTFAIIAADIGIGIARPSLLPWATLLLIVFGLSNIFFIRMVLAWVDRWLSTRRARELLTAFILFASLGFQYLNVTFNPGLQGRHHHTSTHLPLLLRIFHRFILPISALLPPGLTASSIASFTESRYLFSLATLLGLAAFTVLFFAIYALRMHREFRGENLSEVSKQTPIAKPSPTRPPEIHAPAIAPGSTRTFGLSSTITACLQKELIYLRRNTNQLFGFVAPIFMVFLFANRVGGSGRFGSFVFPAAVAYSILGVSVLSYNCLGMDGAGIQFYFLAPTRLRDIFLAKNLIGFLLSLVEFVLIFAVISFVAHPPSPVVAVATLCWLLFATLTNGAIGNLRSLIAPKKIDLSKVSRKQTSQLSALIALGVVLACFAIGYAGVTLTTHLNQPWLMIPLFLALAIAALILYVRVLNRLDSIALKHRETLSEELCKA